MKSKGQFRTYRTFQAGSIVRTTRVSFANQGTSYAENLIRGDAVPSGNLLRGATDAALTKYREQTAASKKTK
jgi:hypothetical protein